MKSWNYLLQDTKMDAKCNCKSGDKFTLKYYSLSVSTWESPEIIADGKQNMEANDYMFALSLYSHLQILCCWALSGEEYWTWRIFNQIQWCFILHSSLLIAEARIILASTHSKHIQTDNNQTYNCLFFTNSYLEGFKHIASVWVLAPSSKVKTCWEWKIGFSNDHQYSTEQVASKQKWLKCNFPYST